jgi:hypothetical protein
MPIFDICCIGVVQLGFDVVEAKHGKEVWPCRGLSVALQAFRL